MTIGVSFGDVHWAVGWVELVCLEMGVHVGDAVALAVQETPPRAGMGLDSTRRLRIESQEPHHSGDHRKSMKQRKQRRRPRRPGKILESGKWVSRQLQVAKMSGKRGRVALEFLWME